MPAPRARSLASALVIAVGLAGAACTDDDPATAPMTSAADPGGAPATAQGDGQEPAAEAADERPTAADPAAGTEPEDAQGPVVRVTAIDHAYRGLPDSIAAGTRLSLVNTGAEPHELAVFPVPAGETRSIEELLALPEEELATAFGGEPIPLAVIVANPGQDAQLVAGDGVLTEPGRYAVLCFVPVGSPPVALDAEADGPQGDGPTHASQGMWAQVTVS